MSLAAVILCPDSPLGESLLAGQTGRDFVRGAVLELTSHVHEVDSVAEQLSSVYEPWLAEGVERVLLLRDNRPLITPELLCNLAAECCVRPAAVRDRYGHVAAICVALRWLAEQLPVAGPDLDLDALAVDAQASNLVVENRVECMAVVDLVDLAEAERLVRRRINRRWMKAGVRMVDPSSVYLDVGVSIGSGTIVLPNCHLEGHTTVGQDCRIGPNSILCDAQIGHHCTITASVVEEAVMEDHANIGPFGHLRKGARLCRGAHMGNYGEMKNSTLGPGSKMGHFSYLGDATVGKDVNIGAGTITCNYDGERKHKTVIHDGAFIGSDTMLVAPVEIGAGARIGAGSVVTHDIPAGAIAYGVPARIKRMIEEGEDDGPGK